MSRRDDEREKYVLFFLAVYVLFIVASIYATICCLGCASTPVPANGEGIEFRGSTVYDAKIRDLQNRME